MWASGKHNGRGVSAITTLIADGTAIHGDVSFYGGLHLDGSIEGSVTADDENAVLTLSAKGCVHGEVRVPNAVVNGKVDGDLKVSHRLELASEARIEGNVYYRVLEMAAGAQVNGKMVYQSDTPKQLSGPEAAATPESAST